MVLSPTSFEPTELTENIRLGALWKLRERYGRKWFYAERFCFSLVASYKGISGYENAAIRLQLEYYWDNSV